MIHDCIFYTVYRCEYFHALIKQDGKLQECGDPSSYTCNHAGSRFCGRFREHQEKLVTA
jgi:hypothetical protein